jgi:xanthine dehydrogenase accessory factor
MNILKAAVDAAARGEACALCTVIGISGSTPRSGSARMLVFTDRRILGTIGGGAFEHRVISEALSAIKDGSARRFAIHLTRDLGMCCGGAMETYIEPIQSTQNLIIYGGGHVGTATAALGASVGFSVTVIDERAEWIASDRFPAGIRCIESDPRDRVDELPWDLNAYHLIVTHSHQLDQDLLSMILPRPVAWLGMIGSRSKVAKFLIRLRAAGVDPSLFRKLSAPVGLDIGAETPEEIAVSILAELVTVRRRCARTPEPLSHIPIDARGGDGRAKAPALCDNSKD